MSAPGDVRYCFEYPRRIRVGYIGCGGHSWRNVLPTFQYAPIDFIAVCDRTAEKAAVYARQFGAKQSYTSHREMLAKEDLEAVFIVTNYDAQGHPRATELAIDALEAGCHVWMEKPPAASVAAMQRLAEAAARAGRYVLVGFKKMFFPSIEKAKAIISDPAFGTPSSIYARYPQSLPAAADRKDDRAMVGFLDHIVHPGSILLYLMGPFESIYFRREERTGASVTTIRFQSGAIGTLHLSAGQSGTSPLERVEVIGSGANVVVDNGVRLTYYRRGGRGAYGRSPSYLTPDDQAPLYWEPEFSLGQLYNKNLFTLGYVQEVQYFCECILNERPPTKAGLDDALELMRLYEAYRGPEGEEIFLHP
ncbi:MAG TPA: Gfo/Idh/MocA family oxidoreductase [Limnochordia bacterium]